MKSTWFKADNKDAFEGIKTIKNSVSKELEINSKYGFIWKFSSTHYCACVLSNSVYNRLISSPAKARRGEEPIVKFPKEELLKWVKALKIKNNRTAMIERAEGFGKNG